MSSSNLLAHLVASRGLQPEPVATEALAHLLSQSPAASEVLRGIAGSLSPEGSFANLVFTGQAVQANKEGRPDIVGADSTGNRLVIEAKFDASLTGPQADTRYLEWLPEHQEGVLIYLVPANRMPALWPQLLKGPCELPDVPPPDLAHVDAPWISHPLGDGRVVAAMSWEALLGRLHAAVDGADEAASSDLLQLHGLVIAQTRIGWIPLAPGDLPDRSGSQLLGLRDAAYAAAREVTSKRLTNATDDNGFGRWVSTDSGRSFRVGIHLTAWGRLGISPVWVTVYSNDPVRLQALRDGLRDLDQVGGPGVYRVDSVNWGIPVRASLGSESGAAAEQIADQLRRVRDLLNAIPVNAAEVEGLPVPVVFNESDSQ